MSVYKSKTSPFWRYDFRLSNRRFHGSTKRKSKTEARAFVESLRAQILSGDHGKPELTIDQAAALYFEQKGGDATTEYQLANIIRIYGPDALLSEITDKRVAAGIMKRRGEKHRSYKKKAVLVSSASVNRETSLLRRVIRRAQKQGFAVGVVDWNDHLLKEAPERDPILTLDQEVRLIEEAADHLKDPIRFTLITGKRLAEVIKLDWSQVDLQGRSMVFRVKGGKLSRIPIIDAVFSILLRQGPRENGPVFKYQGKRINSFRTAWAGAKRRAGVSIRWHDLRHIAASRMVAAGVDISIVKEILAHSEIKTTMRYVHHQPDALASAMERGIGANSREIPEVESGNGS